MGETILVYKDQFDQMKLALENLEKEREYFYNNGLYKENQELKQRLAELEAKK